MPLLKQLYSPKQFENMTKTLLLWVFLLINILMFSATGSTFTTKGNKRKSKVTIFFCFFSAIFSCPTSLCLISYIKKSNSKSIFFWGMHAAMYGVIMESSKPNTQKRTNLGLHVVQHTKVSQKSK